MGCLPGYETVRTRATRTEKDTPKRSCKEEVDMRSRYNLVISFETIDTYDEVDEHELRKLIKSMMVNDVKNLTIRYNHITENNVLPK